MKTKRSTSIGVVGTGYTQKTGDRVSYIFKKGRCYRKDKAGRPSPERGPIMAHEIAKLLLEKAGTFLQRTQAVEAALELGMPLNEIEEYLDWLDAVRGPALPPNSEGEPPTSESSPN